MGKVVKAVAVIIAIAAIAYFAPGIGLGLLNAIGSTAVAGSFAAAAATALVATVATAALTIGLRALAGPPGTWAPAPTGHVARSFVWPPVRRSLDVLHLDPVEPAAKYRPSWLKDADRFAVSYRGRCMTPMLPADGWIVIDRRAQIEAGDVFVLDTDDARERYQLGDRIISGWRGRIRSLWRRARWAGLIKRFNGIEADTGTMEFGCTLPPTEFETGGERLRYAFKVVGWGRTKRQALAMAHG